MKNLAKAVVAVMKEVKSIKKNSNVGTGNSSYKGVQDMDVKKAVGEAMEKNGLCILPVSIDSKMSAERWVEDTNYGPKQKQQVFTEVSAKYLLLHESGESVELSGYGHGIDSQDKSAGKATTYALKYALLYAFMVPTGDIDDTDSTHSDDQPAPPVRRVSRPSSPQPVQQEKPAPQNPTKKLSLDLGDENWNKVLNFVVTNKDKGLDSIVKTLSTKYDIKSLESEKVFSEFKKAVNE